MVSLRKREAELLAVDRDHPEGVPGQAGLRPTTLKPFGANLGNRCRVKSGTLLDRSPGRFGFQIAGEIAEDALQQRYRISEITSVTDSHVNHGHRYLKVITNRGNRYFNLRGTGQKCYACDSRPPGHTR